MDVCVILAAGEIKSYTKPLEIISTGAFVICADGGRRHAEQMGIEPHFILGDFDSSEVVTGDNVLRLPPEKDDTDTAAAVKEGLSRGCSHFCIFGATGGRMDHTAANITLLSYLLQHGAHGVIYGDFEEITMIKDSYIEINKSGYKYLSVFAFGGDAHGVTLRSVKYPLEDYTLSVSFPLGVSNEITAERAYIEVKSGALLIMQTGERQRGA